VYLFIDKDKNKNKIKMQYILLYSIFLNKYVHQSVFVKGQNTNCLLSACMCMMHRIKYFMCLGMHTYIHTYIGQIRNVSYGKPPLWPPCVKEEACRSWEEAAQKQQQQQEAWLAAAVMR
jgi:hypothetical protein